MNIKGSQRILIQSCVLLATAHWLQGATNDNFVNRVTITGLTNSVTVSNVDATKEVGEPNHAGNTGGKSVWWSWTAPANGVVIVETVGSSLDTILAIYTGNAVSNLTLVASNDDSGGQSTSSLTFFAVAGITYEIAVDGYNGVGGNIVVSVRQGPPPPNDLFSNRAVITGMTNNMTGENVYATKEVGEPSHQGSPSGKSLWWTWSAPTNGVVIVDTTKSSFVTVAAVYTGQVVSNLTEIASHGTSVGKRAFSAITGVAYQIAVDSYYGESGAIVLSLNQGLPPPNDDFANRIVITGTTNTVTGTNVYATKEAGEPNHAGGPGGASVWWTWAATTNGVAVVNTIGSSFDTVLAAYTGDAVSNLTEIASGRNDVSFPVVAGTAYQIAVDSYYGDSGMIVLSFEAPPPNDNFADATPIFGLSNVFFGTLVGATSEEGEPDAAPSVWWVFHAPNNGTVNIRKGDRFFPYLLQVYEGNLLANLSLVVSSVELGVSRCTFSFEARAGNTYYVRASDFLRRSFIFVSDFHPAAVNDAFESRFSLAPNARQVSGTTVGATTQLGEPAHGTKSVWWSWIPTNSGSFILTTAGSTADATLIIYSGTALTNLVLVASNDTAYTWAGTNGPPSDPASRLRLETVAGTTYQIMIAGGAGDVVLDLEKLAIETITSFNRIPKLDRSMDFTAELLLSNLREIQTGPLRIRLIARPWYTSRRNVFFPCPENWPAFDAPDQALGVFMLPLPGTLNPSNSAPISVTGTVPPPFEGSGWGYGYAVVAVLEENFNGVWVPQDTRMIVLGDWPKVGSFNGPGGGVIFIVPTQSAASGARYLQVHIGPAAARQAGAGWRVQGETTFHTDPNFTSLITTNGHITIEFAPGPGWDFPNFQSVELPLDILTVLDMNYTVVPPRMVGDAAGVGLIGTTGTTYRIEYRTNLTKGGWVPLRTNAIGDGFNLLFPLPPTNGLPAAYFRATWLQY